MSKILTGSQCAIKKTYEGYENLGFSIEYSQGNATKAISFLCTDLRSLMIWTTGLEALVSKGSGSSNLNNNSSVPLEYEEQDIKEEFQSSSPFFFSRLLSSLLFPFLLFYFLFFSQGQRDKLTPNNEQKKATPFTGVNIAERPLDIFTLRPSSATSFTLI